MLKSAYDKNLLHKLVAKAVAASATERPIDWQQPIAPPDWISKQQYAKIVVNLLQGEMITAHACEQLSGAFDDPTVSHFLNLQAHEEFLHAGFYKRYLRLLGEEVDPYPAFDRFLQLAKDPGCSVLKKMLVFHVLLENEALSIQKLMAREFPCPLFRDLNRVIALDEARHVTFGGIMIPPMIKNLSKQEKMALFSWTKEFWFETSLALAKDYISHIKWHDKLIVFWLKGGWRLQQKRLENLGFSSS